MIQSKSITVFILNLHVGESPADFNRQDGSCSATPQWIPEAIASNWMQLVVTDSDWQLRIVTRWPWKVEEFAEWRETSSDFPIIDQQNLFWIPLSPRATDFRAFLGHFRAISEHFPSNFITAILNHLSNQFQIAFSEPFRGYFSFRAVSVQFPGSFRQFHSSIIQPTFTPMIYCTIRAIPEQFQSNSRAI